MTEAVDTATTTASGTESATSEAQASQQQAAEQGQQQQAQAQQHEQKPAVPDAYKFESLPEGYDFSAEAQAEWSGVFKELGLTQEQASKLVEMDAKRQAAGAHASEQAAIEFRNQQVSKWESELKQDGIRGRQFRGQRWHRTESSGRLRHP